MADKTALQLLWEWVDEKYPNFNKADIEDKIKELLPVERDAIVEAFNDGDSNFKIKFTGKEYYETMYGK